MFYNYLVQGLVTIIWYNWTYVYINCVWFKHILFIDEKDWAWFRTLQEPSPCIIVILNIFYSEEKDWARHTT